MEDILAINTADFITHTKSLIFFFFFFNQFKYGYAEHFNNYMFIA